MSINWQTSHSPQHKPYERDPFAPWKTYLGEVCPHGHEIVRYQREFTPGHRPTARP